MQFPSQSKPPVGIVFDADLGNTIDDALALAMLYGFQGKNESRVLSVSTTKSSLAAAIFADVLVRFYTGEPGPFAPAIPDRKSTRLNSSHLVISYAVFCLKKTQHNIFSMSPHCT